MGEGVRFRGGVRWPRRSSNFGEGVCGCFSAAAAGRWVSWGVVWGRLVRPCALWGGALCLCLWGLWALFLRFSAGWVGEGFSFFGSGSVWSFVGSCGWGALGVAELEVPVVWCCFVCVAFAFVDVAVSIWGYRSLGGFVLGWSICLSCFFGLCWVRWFGLCLLVRLCRRVVYRLWIACESVPRWVIHDAERSLGDVGLPG